MDCHYYMGNYHCWIYVILEGIVNTVASVLFSYCLD